MKGATFFNFTHDPRFDISIHAPVKGATLSDSGAWSGGLISIHAPVKGATIVQIVVRVQQVYFNPRPREGSDG